MAPGRVTRVRKGERRMDAAFDALVQMGFSKHDIRKKVNELLKVYGGPEGWIFIEEGSYKLLIEELLREKENEAVNEDNVQVDAGSSSAAGALNATEKPSTDMIQASADVGSHQGSTITQMDDVSTPHHDLTNHKDDISTHHELTNQKDDVSPPEIEPFPAAPPPDEPSVPNLSNNSSRMRKRRPCYGWWGSGKGTEIVLLPPMPVSGEAMHQRRWDIDPCERRGTINDEIMRNFRSLNSA